MGAATQSSASALPVFMLGLRVSSSWHVSDILLVTPCKALAQRMKAL